MATPLELTLSRQLFKLDAALEENEQEIRVIYVTADVRRCLERDLPGFVSQWKVEVTPLQQLDALLDDFCSGVTLTYGKQFKPICHIKDGIWELKTPDLRIFGWFWKKDNFIAGAVDTAFKVKSHNLYAGHAGAVARIRDQLDLSDPKFVPGAEPQNVVSNYDLP